MAIAQSMIHEFDTEMATTRRLLAVVPEGSADWTPHKKSMTLGKLAAHVAAIPYFVISALRHTELDFHPLGGDPVEFPKFTNTAEMLESFDKLIAKGRAELEKAKDEDLMVTWSFKHQGVVRMAMPRIAVIRVLAMNHMIHHRGQLSVYLRLLDVPLPSIYGPTADTTT